MDRSSKLTVGQLWICFLELRDDAVRRRRTHCDVIALEQRQHPLRGPTGEQKNLLSALSLDLLLERLHYFGRKCRPAHNANGLCHGKPLGVCRQERAEEDGNGPHCNPRIATGERRRPLNWIRNAS